MGVYRDQRRKKQWGIRVTVFGKRRFFGSYMTKEEAENALQSILKQYEHAKKQTLENYKLRYAKTKPGKAWRVLPVTLAERIFRKFRRAAK